MLRYRRTTDAPRNEYGQFPPRGTHLLEWDGRQETITLDGLALTTDVVATLLGPDVWSQVGKGQNCWVTIQKARDPGPRLVWYRDRFDNQMWHCYLLESMARHTHAAAAHHDIVDDTLLRLGLAHEDEPDDTGRLVYDDIQVVFWAWDE